MFTSNATIVMSMGTHFRFRGPTYLVILSKVHDRIFRVLNNVTLTFCKRKQDVLIFLKTCFTSQQSRKMVKNGTDDIRTKIFVFTVLQMPVLCEMNS